MSSLKLAWRNLGRNRRRTAITGSALALGMGLCVATNGLLDGINDDILRALTRLDLGQVQVHQPSFPKLRAQKLTISDPERVESMAKTLPGVLGASPRAYGYGLVSHDKQSAGVQLVGIDPTAEFDVTELHRAIMSGSPLDDETTPWPPGRALSSEEVQRDQALTRKAEREVLDEIEALDHPSETPLKAKASPPGNRPTATDAAVSGPDTSVLVQVLRRRPKRDPIWVT